MALRAGYKGFKTLGPGLEYDNTTGHLALKGEENPHSLENLSDVSITEPAAEDVLLYDPSEEEWINDDLSNTAAVMAKVDKSDIAPVLSEAVAPEGGLDPKDQFYLDNILYDATTTIPQGTAIVTSGTGQNCEVSDSVTGQIADRVTYEDNGVLGAKNRFAIKSSVVSKNTNGVVFTVNRNSAGQVTSIEASRTASNTNDAYLLLDSSFVITEPMIFNGCPSNGGEHKYQIVLYDGVEFYADNGDGISVPAGSYNINIRYWHECSNNLTFYPMFRLATDTDPTYQPYAQTNRELTVNKTDTTVIGNTEDGATASQDYAVGSHFIRGGHLKKATAYIAEGESLTSGSNYTEDAMVNAFFDTRPKIESSNDLNNVTKTGLYGIGTSPTNAPESVQYCMLLVQRSSSNEIRQIIFRSSTSEGLIYIRTYSGNPATWRPWFKFEGTIVS